MNILITGGSGLVGSRIIELLSGRHKIIAPDEQQMDLIDKTSVLNFIKANLSPDTIINFAAFTNVDGAEAQRGDENGLTWKLNVQGAKNIAEVAKELGIYFVQISTDFIFRGSEDYPGPYKEDSELPSSMDGVSWYGWTKLLAEKEVAKVGGKYSIVRIAYPFRAKYEGKIDFARNFLNLFDQNKLYPLFADQKLTPVFIDDIAAPLEKIVNGKLNGVFHIVTCDTTSPYEFASYLLEKARGTKNMVQKGSMKEFLKVPSRTPRPILGGLDTTKTQEILGMKFKTWKESADAFINQLA